MEPELLRRVYAEFITIPASEVLDILTWILQERRTGKLTLNFVAGKMDGTAEFTQRFSPGNSS